MVTMEHPNGCIHTVRDDLVNKFLSAGWTIKAAQPVPPVTPDKPKTKKRTTKKQ